MRPLEEAARRKLMLWSVALCIGSMLLVPLAARSSIDVGVQEGPAMRTMQLPEAQMKETPAMLSLLRDPFTADPPSSTSVGEDSAIPSVPAADSIGVRVQAGTATNASLPANIGAGGGQPPYGAVGSTVLAIITGERAQALISDGSSTRILTVGERLDGHHILEITASGIRLDDGSIRRLAAQSQ